jgi:hypothetical protein
MTGEKEEGVCTKESGTSLTVAERAKAIRGVVLFWGEADKQLGSNCVAIIAAVVVKAIGGNLAAIKLLVDMAQRAQRADEISDEEIESLGALLMREFHALPGEVNVE